jgi:hypothetical protein
MRKLSLFLLFVLLTTIGFAQQGGYHYSLSVANNSTFNGTLDATITNTTAAGDRGINLNIAQGTNALTGTLDGIYVRATGLGTAAAGRVQGAEIGARLPSSDATQVASEVVAGLT